MAGVTAGVTAEMGRNTLHAVFRELLLVMCYMCVESGEGIEGSGVGQGGMERDEGGREDGA